MAGFSRRRIFGKLRNLGGLQPLARAVVVVAAVTVLATGVTYAALQSQSATLTGNSISTATADLKIGTTASTFAATKTGFTFGGIIPGSTPSPTEGNSFYLKNYGTAPMTLKVAIGTVPTNLANVDLSKVYLVFTRVDTTSSQKLSISALTSAQGTGGITLTDHLSGAAVAQYKTQVTMDEDAFTGTSATIGGIDLVFNGAVVAQ